MDILKFGTSDIENVQNGTIRRSCSGASGHRFRQQPFEFAKISNLSADIVEMLRGNVANLAARHFGRASEPDQCADFIEREAQLARPTNKRQDAEMIGVIDATATRCARWCWQHLDSLVVSDGFDIHGSQFRQPADC